MSELALRALVADDEAVARRRLLRLLGALGNVSVVRECANGREVLEALATAEERIHLLLLDIRMPELTGLEARALLPEDAPYVIFTTAYSEHALEAFDVGGDDYLLKPIEATRLKRAIDRAALRLGAAEVRASQALRRIAVATSRGTVLLDPAELSHAVLDGELVTLTTERGTFFSTLSLRELEEALPDSHFFRVHRRALCNLTRVDRLVDVDTGGYVAHMRDGSTVSVSRQAARHLRRLLRLPG
jgi:two-component system, LytTR family, response regulator